MDIKSLHHVAYRCKDAKETTDFYTKVLGLEYAMAMAEDRVPSTGEQSPYMHIFFRMADGSYVAFFELPKSPPMGRDQNTPGLGAAPRAARAETMETLLADKRAWKRRHRGGGADRPHHLQVDLLLRPERPPARARRRHHHAGHEEEARRGERRHAQGMAKTKKAPHHADWVHKR